MKDAFGSTFLIGLMMVFVIIFVSFTAVIANIAKTFRIKNQIINYVEQYNYDGSPSSVAITKINDEYLSNAGYQRVNGYGSDNLKGKCTSDSGYWDETYGYCIVPNDKDNPKYFKVTVYATVSLPFFDINMSLPISGESKSVVSLN